MKLKFKILLFCLFFLTIGPLSSCDNDKINEPEKTENNDNTQDEYEEDDDDDSGTNWVKCGMCKGKGICDFCHGDGTFPDDKTTCKYCHGSGVCHQCDGSGRLYY